MLIPYLQIPSLPIAGSLAIHPFGVLVATGILTGAALTVRRGTRLGLTEDLLRQMIFYSVFTGFVVAHVLDVLVYQEHHGFADLLGALIDVRSGLSSMGGFAGAVFGLWWWCRRNQQDMLAYADSLAFGLAVGWMFGRLGCYTAHDHPGVLAKDHPGLLTTTFGVDYPCLRVPCAPTSDGFAAFTNPEYRRFDGGFAEVVVAGVLSAFYFVMERFRPRKGFYVAAIATYYGPIRFYLDSYRVLPKDAPGADPRWAFGWTPGQYAALFITAVGIALCVYVARRRPVVYPSA